MEEHVECNLRWSSIPTILVLEVTHSRYVSPVHVMYLRRIDNTLQICDCHTHPYARQQGFFKKACKYSIEIYDDLKWLTTESGTKSGKAAMLKIGFKEYKKGFRISKKTLLKG